MTKKSGRARKNSMAEQVKTMARIKQPYTKETLSDGSKVYFPMYLGRVYDMYPCLTASEAVAKRKEIEEDIMLDLQEKREAAQEEEPTSKGVGAGETAQENPMEGLSHSIVLGEPPKKEDPVTLEIHDSVMGHDSSLGE